MMATEMLTLSCSEVKESALVPYCDSLREPAHHIANNKSDGSGKDHFIACWQRAPAGSQPVVTVCLGLRLCLLVLQVNGTKNRAARGALRPALPSELQPRGWLRGAVAGCQLPLPLTFPPRSGSLVCRLRPCNNGASPGCPPAESLPAPANVLLKADTGVQVSRQGVAQAASMCTKASAGQQRTVQEVGLQVHYQALAPPSGAVGCRNQASRWTTSPRWGI